MAINLYILTVGCTLWCWPLATSTADTDTVDNISLLGLVTQTTSLIRARWAGSTVNDVQLSELYYAVSAKFNDCIARASHEERAHTPRPNSTTSSITHKYIRRLYFEVLIRFRIYWSLFRIRFGLPPSSGHGEGIAAHRTASSFATLQRTLGHPDTMSVLEPASLCDMLPYHFEGCLSILSLGGMSRKVRALSTGQEKRL